MQLIRKLLFPISLLYGLIVFFRNRLYDMGVFSSKTFAVKTICVGNLSVGGTGKTPMIELLVRELGESFRVAILSRGYKRKTKGFLLAGNHTSVEELGDEPFQLKKKFPKVAVAVDADRKNGINQLMTDIDPDVILLDDAFQHRKVKPDFSILLTAYDNLYVNDRYLPTGDLRDFKGEANRADIIVITKCPGDLSNSDKSTILLQLAPKHHQRVFFSYLDYNRDLKGVEMPLESLKTKNVTLVTGIANPTPLEMFLKSSGITFEHLKFNDHHFFTDAEIEDLKKKETILTTEKDYVRLKSKIPNLHYIEVKHEFLYDGKEALRQELLQFMTKNS
ncbi:tetraacyldisaccharide 4'-kinase [Maribacter dokdonensis]|uniref:tetraacyldisaccharide 4'-kinase n=1 Tax=Maribacter dokdonensis TaxID=320912 RepID=UPI002AB1A3B4|nr:tetraacyldisaccharide 4'-kinase [Maribacter dokdonensis]